MKSTKARKQRKAFFNAPLHQRRKQIGSHLEENLLLKYDKRRMSVVKGDTVKIMRGAFKGHENKVTAVHLKKHLVEVEGVTITKADGKQVAKPVHPSNLLITKLNLTDKWRRQRLEEGLSSETKQEIEQEATDQIKQIEEERREEEERRRKEEEEAAAEEEQVVEEEKEEETVTPEEEEKKPSVEEEKEEKEAAAEEEQVVEEEKEEETVTPEEEEKKPSVEEEAETVEKPSESKPVKEKVNQQRQPRQSGTSEQKKRKKMETPVEKDSFEEKEEEESKKEKEQSGEEKEEKK